MAKFRRKNRDVVEAVQWQPGTAFPGLREFTAHRSDGGDPETLGFLYPYGEEGPRLVVSPGDWIVTADEGDGDATIRYVLTADGFAASFEPAD